MRTELTLLSRVSYRDREITGPRLRGLLALLASDLRTGRSTAPLVEGLWPDEQPENPTKALQVLVSRARAQLGSDVIARTPTGYRITLGEDQVDTSAVLLRASASARHSRAGDHAAALADAEAGLALWEGAASGGTADDDPLSALRAERAATHRSLLRARALSLSRLGRRAEAVEVLTALDPERARDEEVLLELLRCEAATVGPSAALGRYDGYRRSLRDQLGTDPGPALQTLQRELLRDDEPAVRHGVPHEPNLLLGRADDIAAVADLLRASRVTSIVGPGGLGKTRLAQVLSRQAEQRVVHLVALAGVAHDDDVAWEVASVLVSGESRLAAVGRAASPTDAIASIVAALGPAPALLVLDNCEHVIRGAAELVRALVSRTRDLRVLTTSRAPLNLASESVYLLPGLGLSTAVQLFEQRARAARPGVDLSADTVEEVCRHLDGLPLAVELAAARTRIMSVADVARRLEDRFALLRGGARDAPQRHHTLHAVVDWSWNLLEPAAQEAMRALSVFPGGFTTDAAGHLLGDDEVDQVLEHLVDQSLLTVTETPSGTRLRMLETVREFSAAQRAAAGENDRVLDALLAWARDFGVAHHESPFGADPFRSVARVRAEQDNLLQALRHGLARADGATVAATAAVLASLWIVETNFTRLIGLTEDTARILSHFRPEPDLVEVTRSATTLCTVATFAIQGPRALRALVTLRRLPPAPPSTLVRAMAIVLRAMTEAAGRDHEVLQELCDSDEPLLTGVANGMASYLWESDDVELALAAAGRMVAALEHRGSSWMLAMAHLRCSELCLQVDLGDQPRRHLRAALVELSALGAPSDVIDEARLAMALAVLRHGDLDEAEHWLAPTTPDSAEADIGTVTFALGVRAEILLARGRVDAGLGLWRQAVDRLRHADSLFYGIGLDRDPWVLEVQAVAVVAHAWCDRLELVSEVAGELSSKLSTMLSDPLVKPSPVIMEFPVNGALLLALAMVDLNRGATGSAARMIALAERFGFLRNFQPTMSAGRARHAAEQAHPAAYADAVSSYADLDRDQLRAAALAALRERDLR